MKNSMHIRILALLLAGATGVPLAATAATCADSYFSADDFDHKHPLPRPAAAFEKSYGRAQAGDAVEQRNVAVSYDAGYLVSACPEKAHYWYAKAADSGDQIARDWIARYNMFEQMQRGPEFAITNHAAATPSLASAGAGHAADGPQANLDPVERMLREVSEISRPPDPDSDQGKLIKAGQFLDSAMHSSSHPAADH